MSSTEAQALVERILAAGETVRSLKASNADKAAVDTAVAALLAVKTEYKTLTGTDYAPPKEDKKDKKGKKDAAPAAAAAAAAPADAPAAAAGEEGGEGGESKSALKKKAKQEAREKVKSAKQEAAAVMETKAPAKAKAKKDKAEKADKEDGDELPKERFDFIQAEEEMLKLWKDINAFETSVKFSEGRPEFNFYDGPPFATGQPHYGHLLAGTIKDVVTRYAHQTGHFVSRRFGWDCHGLPVEYEIDKTLNIKGPNDVLAMGIDKYNAECRSIVMRYSGDWRSTVTRLGRWIDFDNDYKTMYPWFMESVWWVFQEIFKKGLVYRGYKVMPFSTALATPLSNFEANQDMHNVDDPSVTVTFPIEGEDAAFLAWTTTPWTLPSNLALCVHPTMEYARFKDKATGKVYIALKSRIAGKGCLYKDESEVEILETFPGDTLRGKRYQPLFPYFLARKDRSFKVVSDTYVTDESGTGIVHQAPGHGEDDYRVCVREGVITSEDIPCPVDGSGCYTAEVADYKGMYIKDADKVIMKDLTKAGRMFHQGTINHAYPHCWRSGTPLIRKTVDSWFIRVEAIKDRLVAHNKDTYWVPNHIREGRFHNWLCDARDWAISRNRFWGTPIPLWVSDDYEEVVCIGSIEELRTLSGVQDIGDLHRESIDHITIPSKKGKGVLRRVPQVFDCWFESGSMPYAQKHYPFENKEAFEKAFPADFIAEGVDQTRGWFYTLLIIGTILFDKPAWKNLIVNGLVLAEDGCKMSKRLKNYPDPNIVLNEDGADPLRLYLITSPAVRAEDLNFSRKGVQALRRDVFLPWLNVFRFFEQSALLLKEATGSDFTFDSSKPCPTENKLDKWILAFTQSLLEWVHQEMKAYRLYTVVPRLLKFIDNLTNWYVRFNRKRLKGANGEEDARLALWTLGEVLLALTKAMSPFTPFFAEWLYQKLRPYVVNVAYSGDAEGAASSAAQQSPEGWASGEVGAWLASAGLAQHVALFGENGITGRDLLDMNHEDLQSMGLARCSDRKAVLRAVKALADATPAVAASATTTTTTTPAEAKAPRVIDGVSEEASVHFQMIPHPKKIYYNEAIVRAFEFMKRAIEAGRLIRDRATLPVKYPLRELVVITKTAHALDDIKSLEEYIKSELNVQCVTVSVDETDYGFRLTALPDSKALGQRLGADFKAVAKGIQALTHAELVAARAAGKVVVCGHEVSVSELLLTYSSQPSTSTNYSAHADGDMIMLLDLTVTQEMIDEGVAREFVNRVQKLRKKGGLQPLDKITIVYKVTEDDEETHLDKVIKDSLAKLSEALDGQPIVEGPPANEAAVICKDETSIKSADLALWIVKRD